MPKRGKPYGWAKLVKIKTDYIRKNLKDEERTRRLGTIKFLPCDDQTTLKIPPDLISRDIWTLQMASDWLIVNLSTIIQQNCFSSTVLFMCDYVPPKLCDLFFFLLF